jgi:starch phosphorylase
VVLGIGGVRALTAMGIEPEVVHLNEGTPPSRRSSAPGRRSRPGTSLDDAAAQAKQGNRVHHPHPGAAGNDVYPATQ